MVDSSSRSYIFSLVIPTHNRNQDLFNLINYLLEQTLFESMQIIVISNLFDESLQKFIKQMDRPNIVYDFVGSVGVNKARNKGISLSQGDWIYFLDDDCLPNDSSFFETAAKKIALEPNYLVWGGLYMNMGKMNRVSKYYIYKANSWILQNSYDEGQFTDMLLGGNLLIKSKLFKEGLRFNEEIVFGSSETEMINRLRLIASPFRLSKELNLIHNLNIKWFDLFRKAYLQGYGSKLAKISLHRKYRMPMATPEKYKVIDALFNKVFYLGYMDQGPAYSNKFLKIKIVLKLMGLLVRDLRYKSLDLLKEIYSIFVKN